MQHKGSKIHSKNCPVSLDELEYAYNIYAWVVKQYGEKYLPTFIRLHEEIQKRKTYLAYIEEAIGAPSNDNSL